jgi:putative phosphoribosyl transferase
MNETRFTDRRDAGHRLADHLIGYRDLPDAIVLALPRGGVPVAAEVARAIRAPLDVLVVRKIGVPSQPELAMGAIASIAGTIETVTNDDVLAYSRSEEFEKVAERETTELARRQAAYRGDQPPVEVTGRTVILVDDGLATGATMRAAIAVVRHEGPARLAVAVPVGSPGTCDEIRGLVDELICLYAPRQFWAVGQAYDDFGQTTDDEVRTILAEFAETDQR